MEWGIGMVSNLCLTLIINITKWSQVYCLPSETTCLKRPFSLLPMSGLLTQILLHIIPRSLHQIDYFWLILSEHMFWVLRKKCISELSENETSGKA